jgi:hypothetical protein
MTITVRDRDFKIDFVNNFCREQYQTMLETAEELTELPDEVRDAAGRDEIKALQAKRKKLVNQIGVVRETILKELLETNGHEYDRNWWLHKTDVDDVNRFVVDSLRKDLKGNVSKKN